MLKIKILNPKWEIDCEIFLFFLKKSFAVIINKYKDAVDKIEKYRIWSEILLIK